jgi:membrane protein
LGSAIDHFFGRHPQLKAFIDKFMKDNVGMLASVVAWTLFTSIVPILAGLVAISGLFLHDPGAQRVVIAHLSAALQNVFSPHEIQAMVKATVQHNGLLALIGFAGVLWGGSNVGGAISTVFQPIFQVRGRDFLKEKLLDIGMIFVLTILMLVIVGGTTAVALLDRLFGAGQPGIITLTIGTITSLVAAFLLFAVIYTVFPNTEPRFKIRNIWPGAAIAAVLFQALTYIFPFYTKVSHFGKYAALLVPILLLTAWIYFFSLILVVGAEFVSFRALREARREGEEIGPPPDGTVPQRTDVPERESAHAAS